MLPALVARHSTLFLSVGVILLLAVKFSPHSPSLVCTDEKEGWFECVRKMADHTVDVVSQSATNACHTASDYAEYLRG